MPKGMPEVIYVYREVDGDETYLICNETAEECASLTEDRLVGVYDLRGVGKLLVTVELPEVEKAG